MSPEHSYRYLFGPVPSRRLGSSLGVDVVPFKTCTYDCVYCQLGRTTDKICDRREFFPAHEIVKEIGEGLANMAAPDYITLSGSGEPTLYSKLGEIITGIKKITDIRVAVLTNGSLLFLDEVRRSVMEADLVIPSLDAGDEETFGKVNRPHPEITFEKMVQGLVALRREFSGPFWLEVFMVNNMTTRKEQILRITSLIEKIGPDRVQLNTALRGAAEEFVEAVSLQEMREIRSLIGGNAEIISHDDRGHEESGHEIKQEDIFNLLRRRPCTIDDISSGLNIHRNEAIKHVTALKEKDLIAMKRSKGTVLYVAHNINMNQR
ncbi:MAG TPA: radical SAM protein [Deltaproteobacteria bacterium]|nr:radical SAM protein [Deltaproteobacteria bacterium]